MSVNVEDRWSSPLGHGIQTAAELVDSGKAFKVWAVAP